MGKMRLIRFTVMDCVPQLWYVQLIHDAVFLGTPSNSHLKSFRDAKCIGIRCIHTMMITSIKHIESNRREQMRLKKPAKSMHECRFIHIECCQPQRPIRYWLKYLVGKLISLLACIHKMNALNIADEYCVLTAQPCVRVRNNMCCTNTEFDAARNDNNNNSDGYHNIFEVWFWYASSIVSIGFALIRFYFGSTVRAYFVWSVYVTV